MDLNRWKRASSLSGNHGSDEHDTRGAIRRGCFAFRTARLAGRPAKRHGPYRIRSDARCASAVDRGSDPRGVLQTGP